MWHIQPTICSLPGPWHNWQVWLKFKIKLDENNPVLNTNLISNLNCRGVWQHGGSWHQCGGSSQVRKTFTFPSDWQIKSLTFLKLPNANIYICWQAEWETLSNTLDHFERLNDPKRLSEKLTFLRLWMILLSPISLIRIPYLRQD